MVGTASVLASERIDRLTWLAVVGAFLVQRLLRPSRTQSLEGIHDDELADLLLAWYYR